MIDVADIAVVIDNWNIIWFACVIAICCHLSLCLISFVLGFALRLVKYSVVRMCLVSMISKITFVHICMSSSVSCNYHNHINQLNLHYYYL
jgi:hypothetical protein